MSDDIKRAREELDRQKERTEKRSSAAVEVGSWFRRQRQENGWRVMIEQIVVKGST